MKKYFLMIVFMSSFFFYSYVQAESVFMVMDFESADTESRKYQQHSNKTNINDDEPILKDHERAMLNGKDLGDLSKAEITERMQKRSIDAQKLERENLENKQRNDDYRARAVSSALGREIIQGPALLSSELSKYGYSVVNRRYSEEAVGEINFQNSGLVQRSQSEKLGSISAANYLVKTNVSDYQRESFSQMNYNIATKSIVHSLEVTVTVMKTGTNVEVASAIGTMKVDELKTNSSSSSNSGLMRTLLKGALADAVASLDMQLKKRPEFRVVNESSANISSAKPKVYFEPKDATGKEIDVEIEIDGEYAGNAPSQVSVSEGQHAIKFIKNGVEVWSKNFNLKDGMKISPTISSK